MSNIKELIREKIDAFYTEYKAKFHQNGDSYHLGIIDGLDMAERILDTLPDESEQPTRGYNEAYLNEKIAKASKSWEGVDVDKFMDEVRGREPVTTCNQFEEAAEAYSRQVSRGHNYRDLTCGFKAGAEWQKAKMMEGAVEGLICATITGTNAISFLSPLPKELTAGSEVRIIILPKEDKK